MGAMPFTVQMSGTMQSDPSTVVDQTDMVSQSIDLAFKKAYDACFAGNLPIAGVFTPGVGAVVKVRAICIRAVDQQSLVVTVTWSGGTAQRIPVSNLLVLCAQNTGDEITAITITGTGRIEYLIAGNKT